MERQGYAGRANVRYEKRHFYGSLYNVPDVLQRDDHGNGRIRRICCAEEERHDLTDENQHRDGSIYRNGNRRIHDRCNKERADRERLRQCRVIHDLLCADALFCFGCAE